MISSSNMVQYQLKNDDYCGRRHISRHFERQSNLDSIDICPYMLSIPCYRSRLLYIYVTFKRFELIHFQIEQFTLKNTTQYMYAKKYENCCHSSFT